MVKDEDVVPPEVRKAAAVAVAALLTEVPAVIAQAGYTDEAAELSAKLVKLGGPNSATRVWLADDVRQFVGEASDVINGLLADDDTVNETLADLEQVVDEDLSSLADFLDTGSNGPTSALDGTPPQQTGEYIVVVGDRLEDAAFWLRDLGATGDLTRRLAAGAIWVKAVDPALDAPQLPCGSAYARLAQSLARLCHMRLRHKGRDDLADVIAADTPVSPQNLMGQVTFYREDGWPEIDPAGRSADDWFGEPDWDGVAYGPVEPESGVLSLVQAVNALGDGFTIAENIGGRDADPLDLTSVTVLIQEVARLLNEGGVRDLLVDRLLNGVNWWEAVDRPV